VEVILMKSIGGLGALGDKVNVRPGYGRNYLVPGGFAVPATAANLEAFEARRAELERDAASSLASAESRKAALEGMRVTIARKAGDEGRLFGSVGAQDIAAAITAPAWRWQSRRSVSRLDRSGPPASSRSRCTCTRRWIRASR
jgi:large subunit ribosomal protein L9